MRSDSNQLDLYLARVHRRWMIWRIVERVGLCLFISSVIATVLSIILIARGDSSMPLVAVCLGVGFLAGAVLGWITRPSLFDSAAEVDRQLDLSDLLATALSIRRSQTLVVDGFDHQWSATIIALAEARCASIANQSLVLRRFGARAWGGIGLSAAIVLTLGALSSNPLITHARDAMSRSSDSESANEADARLQPDPRNTFGADAAIPKESESAQHTRIDAADSNAETSKAAEASQGNQASASAADRAGSGRGRTDSSLARPADLSGTSLAKNSSRGEQATGGGESANGSQHGKTSSTSTGGANGNGPATPWNSSDWRQAQQRAKEQIRAGNVPDAYRDVVRDYFAR